MTPANEDIIRKIQKLVSLGTSIYVAEAALAMARAQELLARHNLDYTMVRETAVAGGTVAPAEEKREKTKLNRSAKFAWQRQLWGTLASANFCWHWIVEVYEGKRGAEGGSKKAVKRHMVLGRESNVISVRLMGEYLEDTIERLLPYSNAERHSNLAFSWKTGCAERICQRIREKAEAMREESDKANTAGALVLRSVVQSEYEANYDARYGAGRYAQKLLQDAQCEKENEEAKAQAERDREKAERDWLIYLQNETPEQKKEREKEEARQTRLAEKELEKARNRRYRSYGRADAVTVNSEAYRAGSKAGDKVNLGSQLKDNSERRIG